jgi:hypothetical protein
MRENDESPRDSVPFVINPVNNPDITDLVILPLMELVGQRTGFRALQELRSDYIYGDIRLRVENRCRMVGYLRRGDH